jgi:acyl-CoA synthetase (AMP-forming)/AMP-acid ligase II
MSSVLDGPMTRDEAIEFLKSETSPLHVVQTDIRGVEFDVYEHAPNDMRDYFTYSNTHFKDKPFLVYFDERYTYGENHQRTISLCHRLREKGVKAGDRVGICMRNYPEYCAAVEAILSIGAVAVTLNSWWTEDELHYGIGDSGTRFIFVDQERWDILGSSLPLLDLGVAIARPAGELPEGVIDMADWLAPVEGVSLPTQPIDTDSDAIIMYTSGSTGHPKGVVLTHRSTISALMNYSFIGMLAALIQDDDVGLRDTVYEWALQGVAGMDDPIALRLPETAMLVNVPFFHVSGLHTMQFMSYRAGRKLVLMHKWNAEKALELAEAEKLTTIEGVPTMIGEILNSADLPKRDISSVTKVGGGGSARPPEHVKMLQERIPQAMIGTGYGMTETDSIGATIGGDDYIERPSSVGRPSPALVSIEIRDDKGNVLGVGEEGEICMKSAANMRCYWNKPEASAETLVDGWILSGDLGHIDDEGFVFITGRAKDIIIRGGENIACAEIEYSLYEHAGVNEASVHGAPDDRLGEIVCATVFLKEGCDHSEEEIKAHVKTQLAAFKVPTHIFFVDEPLPRIASGKFDKRALQKRGVDLLEASKTA